jgi:transposase-like protein
MSSLYVIVLTVDESAVLAARVACRRTEFRDRLRAQIVLEAARGGTNAAIADRVEVCVDTARTWRRRVRVRAPGGPEGPPAQRPATGL